MAFHGLGDFVSLGREAAYITHRKSLADFTQGTIERWIQRGSETEGQNAKPAA
jgi:hypothetical protein